MLDTYYAVILTHDPDDEWPTPSFVNDDISNVFFSPDRAATEQYAEKMRSYFPNATYAVATVTWEVS